MTQATLEKLPFNNSNLFSAYYLSERLRDRSEWDCDEDAREALDNITELYELEKDLLPSYKEDPLIDSWIDEVLDITKATYMKDVFVEALSRGMKQKVGIARTLIHNPEVLLLDEPLSGLDPTARVEMKDLLRTLVDNGKTILVSSHILPELSAISDTIGMLNHGKLIASGPVNTVMKGIRQERLIEIQFLSDAEKAITLLQNNNSENQFDKISRTDQMVRFEINANDKQIAALLNKIVSKGFNIVQFREVPISLEEAFIELASASNV